MSEGTEITRDAADVETLAGPELPSHLLAKLRVTIPGYDLLGKIASGGQATVYRAREQTSGLTVAVKVLHGGSNAGDDARERFHRETAALKALSHPNIVCVIESGRTPIGLDYLVMNYVDGRPLDVLWKDPKFSAAIAPEPPARLRLFKHICDIVQAAHLKGITHRDLSPSNILIATDGEPHVLDFGLASTAFNRILTPEGLRISVTGQFLGKVQYAAPEQARGGRDAIDIRTDVYALGVILYQILTNGAFPYEVVGNLIDVLNNIVHTKPLSPSALLAARQQAAHKRPLRHNSTLVNDTIEAVVLKALEKNPADRYQSAGELAADIDQYLAGRPTAAVTHRPPANPKIALRLRKLKEPVWVAVVLLLITGIFLNARGILIHFRSAPAAASSPISQRPTETVASPALPVKPAQDSVSPEAKGTPNSVGAVPNDPHVFSSEWRNLLEPAQLGGWVTAPQPDPDGTFTCRSRGYAWGTGIHDVRIRATVQMISGQFLSLALRDTDGTRYFAFFNGGDWFGICLHSGEKTLDLGEGHASRTFAGPFVMEFSAIGDQLVLSADGEEVLRVRDGLLKSGSAGFGTYKGDSIYKDIQVQVLDNASAKPGAAAQP
jgi:serine/threonine protein kinase